MVGYYFGGSLGSGIGTFAYHIGHVSGMVISGGIILGLAILYFMLHGKENKSLNNRYKREINTNLGE
ncbi:hypothetical protein D3C74_419780 [compost metagenome]